MRPVLFLTFFACVVHANPQQPEKLPAPAADPAPPAPPAVPKPPAFFPGAAKIQGEALNCEVMRVEYVTQTIARRVIKEGRAVTETMTVAVPTYIIERRLIPVKDVQAYVIDPKVGDPTKALQKLDPTKLPAALTQTPKPLIAGDGRVPTPADLKEVKQGSLLLVLPPEKPEPKPVPLPRLFRK